MSTPNPVVGQWQPSSLTQSFLRAQSVVLEALSKIATVAVVQVVSCSNSGTVAASGTVVVQPLVNMVNGALQPLSHGQITNVPYWRCQFGPFAIIADPVAGDIGLCLFASRDSSVVKARALGKGLPPNTKPMNPSSPAQYDWSDGFYLGSVMTAAPTNYIRWDGTNLEIVTGGALNITASGGVNINGAQVSANGEVQDAAGIVLGTHEHTAGTLQAPSGGGQVTGDTGAPT